MGQRSWKSLSAKTPALNYTTFTAILIERFTVTNAQIADYHFRSAKQIPSENLQNFSTRLQTLAVTAAIPAANINQQILSVIRNTTDHHEIRMKCLENDITLATLLTWRQQHDAKSQCAALMNSDTSTDSICQIKSNKDIFNSPRLCYTCGYEYPHKGGSELRSLLKFFNANRPRQTNNQTGTL